MFSLLKLASDISSKFSNSFLNSLIFPAHVLRQIYAIKSLNIRYFSDGVAECGHDQIRVFEMPGFIWAIDRLWGQINRLNFDPWHLPSDFVIVHESNRDFATCAVYFLSNRDFNAVSIRNSHAYGLNSSWAILTLLEFQFVATFGSPIIGCNYWDCMDKILEKYCQLLSFIFIRISWIADFRVLSFI
jgi:hypothetical protein